MLWKFYNEDKNFSNKLLFLSLLILPFQTFLGILILVYICYQASVKNWSQIRHNYLTFGFICLSLLLMVSSIFAYKSGEAWLGTVHFLPFFWVFLSLRTIIKTYEQLYIIILSLVLSSIIVVLIAIGEINFHWVTIDIIYKLFGWQLTGEGIPPGRASSVFPYANPLALYLAITIILSTGLLIKNSQKYWFNKINLCLVFTIALNIYGLILTGSRNGWIIVFLSLIAFAIYRNWYFLLSLITFSGIIVSWASFGNLPLQDFWRRIVPNFLWQRFSDQMYVSSDRPLETLRTTQWNFCLDLIEKHPLLGWGLRNFTVLYEEKMGIYLGHPHNFFLMMGAETGLITLGVLLGLIAIVLAKGLLMIKEEKIEQNHNIIFFSYLVAFGAYIIYNLFDVSLFDLRLNILAWVILGAISGICENTNQNEQIRIVNK